MRLGSVDVVKWAHACAAAVQFLTRIPLPVKLNYDDDLFRRSAVFYPLAGMLIGAVLVLSGKLLEAFVPPFPASVLLLGVWIALTGGLHLDGLMDTADGLLSHRSRERMLEIMKDSRVGAMGVLAAVWLLLLKTALLLSLLQYAPQWIGFLFVIPVWSRWFMVWAIAGWPYAREGGMGQLFASVTRREAMFATCAAAFVTMLAFVLMRFHWWAAIGYTAAFVILTALCGWLIGIRIVRKLGGMTGDTYGALNELLECTLLLVIIIWGYR
jgi:adenosylcobinamide-GDP ribazoletransferase